MDILNQTCHLKSLSSEDMFKLNGTARLSLAEKNIKSIFLYIIDVIVNIHCDTTVQLLLITPEYGLYKSSFFSP